MPTYDSYSSWQTSGKPKLPWAPALNKYFNQGSPTAETRESYAKSLGYKMDGNGMASKPFGSSRMTVDLNYLRPPKQSFNEAILSDLAGTLGSDAEAMQGAADRQYNRVDQQAQRYEGELTGDIDSILGSYASADALLGQGMDRFEGAGDRAASAITDAGMPGIRDAMGNVDEIFGDLRGDRAKAEETYGLARGEATGDPGIDEAYGRAADEYAQGLSDYEEKAGQFAASQASGIQRRAQMASKAQGPVDASGRPVTQGQMGAMDLAQQREADAAAQEQVATTMRSVQDNLLQAKGVLAGLRGQVGEGRSQEAQIRLGGIGAMQSAIGLMGEISSKGLQGAQLKGELAARASQIATDAETARRDYDTLWTSVANMRTSLMTQGPQVVAQLRQGGRELIAGLIERNPESVTSKFQMLLGLLSAYSSLNGAFGASGGGGGGGTTTYNVTNEAETPPLDYTPPPSYGPKEPAPTGGKDNGFGSFEDRYTNYGPFQPADNGFTNTGDAR